MSYRELFRIECRHAWFADGICRAVELRATAGCARLLDRCDGLVRPSDGGIVVFCGSPGPFSQTMRFSFSLRSTGSQLSECTEMDGQNGAFGESLFYYSNLRDYGAAPDGLPLHPSGKPFAVDRVPVWPERLDYRFAKPLSAPQVTVSDMLDNALRTLKAPARASALRLDLSGLPEGRCRLKAAGTEDSDFYLGGDASPLRWGAIEIFAGGPKSAEIPESYRVPDAAENPPPRFTISFEPRSARWRYYIVSQSPADRTYDDYRIAGGPPKAGRGNGGRANGTAPAAFSEPAKQKLNGMDAWVFESETDITLYENPGDHHEFTLTRNGRNGSGVSLPYGQAGNTRLERTDKGATQAWSEIYVYL